MSYLEYQVVRKGFSNVNFEHRPKGHEGMNLVDNARESILGREDSKYKCLEAEACRKIWGKRGKDEFKVLGLSAREEGLPRTKTRRPGCRHVETGS